jgi:hypothetical protein
MGAAAFLECMVSENQWRVVSHCFAYPDFFAFGNTAIRFLFCAIYPIQFGLYLTDARNDFGQTIFFNPIAMNGMLKK